MREDSASNKLPKEYHQDNPPCPCDQVSWEDDFGDPTQCNRGGGGNIQNPRHPTIKQDGMGGS